MQYWHAITLASKQLPAALALPGPVFRHEPNWRILTGRLPRAGLLTVSPQELRQILALK